MAGIKILPVTGRGGSFRNAKPEFQIGDEVTLVCSEGYLAPRDNRSRVVRRHGYLVWEPAEINCVPLSLLKDLPKTGEGGTFKPLNNATPPYHVRDRAQLECEAGYIRPSVFHISTVVVKNGKLVWEPDALHCDPVQCTNPPDVEFGRTSSKEYSFGGTFAYICDPGYVFNKPVNGFRCNEKGKWEPEIPIDVDCVPVECPEFKVKNANVTFYSQRRYRSIASVQCKDGYVKSSGSEMRTCREDGTWDGTAPSCVPKNSKNNNYLTVGIILFAFLLILAIVTLKVRNKYVLLLSTDK